MTNRYLEKIAKIEERDAKKRVPVAAAIGAGGTALTGHLLTKGKFKHIVNLGNQMKSVPVIARGAAGGALLEAVATRGYNEHARKLNKKLEKKAEKEDKDLKKNDALLKPYIKSLIAGGAAAGVGAAGGAASAEVLNRRLASKGKLKVPKSKKDWAIRGALAAGGLTQDVAQAALMGKDLGRNAAIRQYEKKQKSGGK